MKRLALATALATSLHAEPGTRPLNHVPLPPELEGATGLHFADLNGDGFEDLVYSNATSYGVRLFNDVERANIGWSLGWCHVVREGKAGDATALPRTDRENAALKDGFLWIDGAKTLSFEDLRRPPAPPARSPQESLKAIRVHPGFTVELVASEPLVRDPIHIDWDARGRMWVVEMGDYPFHEFKGSTHSGRVKILEDTDADGVYDKATTFLDNLTYPTGLACWKDGVFVSSVPDVFYAADTDGDGVADVRKPVLSGFKQGNPQHLVNGFAWGLDGAYYGGNGDSGGAITDHSTGKVHELGGRDFSFDPRTGHFRLESGRAQFGRWRDDFGNWFGNNNWTLGWHYLFEDRHLARNPLLAVPSVKQSLNPQGTRVFPISAPLPRLNQPKAVNKLTSGSNPLPYRDTLFGPAFSDSLFISEPANNLIHRETLVPNVISFTSRRPADEPDFEFLASEDHWSRFTLARPGPDGALYVVDMYRLIIEHPEWIPKQIVDSLDLYAGNQMGRIYRVRPTSQPLRPFPPTATADEAQLGKLLESPSGWTRDTAQRLLIERGSRWKSSALTGSTAAKTQQLWAMHTLGTLAPELLARTLRDPDPLLREQAAAVAEFHLSEPAIFEALPALVTDPSPRVRMRATFSLGARSTPEIEAAIGLSVAPTPEDPATLVAALSAAPEHPDAPSWRKRLADSYNTPAGTAPATLVSPTQATDRAKIVRAHAAVATLPGDPTRGRTLFQTHCIACHRLKGEGSDIGPDLGTIAGKPAEQIIEAILDPNRAVEDRYLSRTFTLRDGRQSTGMLAEETANSITLKLGGSTQVILRADIAKSETNPRSLMPEGYETVLNPAQLADLIAWIRAE